MTIATHVVAEPMLSVLIVEDDLVTRGMLSAMLAKNHTVIEAADGQSGIAAFMQHKPDVVLLDIHLPDMTGYEVANRLRYLHDDAYIVMLSADDADAALILNHAEGVAGFIKKPFVKEAIVGYLEKFQTLARDAAVLRGSSGVQA